MTSKKKLKFIQFFLLIFAITIIYITYYKKDLAIDEEIISQSTKEKLEKQRKEGSSDEGDIFFNVEYKGLDLNGNRYLLKSEEIAAYLFSFNPEPGTIMENTPRTPITRTRRIQLVKNLIEEHDLPESSIKFDELGAIRMISAPRETIKLVTEKGVAFMTDGCPDRQGKMACNRPYGSYRPGEEFRDYPFLPDTSDLKIISNEMKLGEIVNSNESALV